MITFQLVGGLGNQLFGYYAGLYAAGKHGTTCCFDKALLPHDVERYGEIEKSFKIDEVFINSKSKYGLVQWTITRIKMRILQIGICRNQLRNIFKADHSHGVGYDQKFLVTGQEFLARGYFQTYKYFAELKVRSGYSELQVRNPTAWYKEYLLKLSAEKPTIVHIRRGDYLNHDDEIGVLGPSYYVEAIKLLSKLQALGPIWVLSDDVEEARNAFADALGPHTQWLSPPLESDSAESLLLMSKAPSLVIANSTFSWWGAALGNSDKVVVAPMKWFKFEKDPIDLIPENWQRVPSNWSQ